MRGLFCLFGVVFATILSACSDGCGRRLDSGCGCVDHLAGPGAVLVRGPPHGWAYCVGAPPPPMVGRAVLVCAPPHGGACCVGLWSPSWWGVLCWCVRPPWWGVLCRCVPPPPWWSVLRWFVTPLVMGRAALVRGPPPGRACRVGACPPRSWCVVWGVVICSMGCGRGCVVGLAGVGAVLVRAPPPLLGRALFVRGPPLGGACCVGVFGFRFVVL